MKECRWVSYSNGINVCCCSYNENCGLSVDEDVCDICDEHEDYGGNMKNRKEDMETNEL